MPEPLTWSDAELDAALDAFRTPTADPDLSALRDRLVGDAHRAQAHAQPHGTLVTVDEPDRAPAPRSRWQAVGTAAAVLAVVAVADAVAVVVPTPGLTPAAPAPGPVEYWPDEAYTSVVPITELMANATDPVLGEGQFRYQRIEQKDGVVEVWIPADRSDEWLRRETTPDGQVTDTRTPAGDFFPPRQPGDDSWPFPGGLTLAEQARDPAGLAELLQLSVAASEAPAVSALASAAGVLTKEPLSADRRSLVVAALGHIPGMRLVVDRDTTSIVADGLRGGLPVRQELRIHVPTGEIVATLLVDSSGTYGSVIRTGVADGIGEPPNP